MADDFTDDAPEPEDLGYTLEAEPEPEAESGIVLPSVEEWSFYAAIATMHHRPLPKRRPPGVAEYIAELIAEKPHIKLFRTLQTRLEEERPRQLKRKGGKP